MEPAQKSDFSQLRREYQPQTPLPDRYASIVFPLIIQSLKSICFRNGQVTLLRSITCE